MSKNKTLSAAKSAKNDEFYTQYADIQKEVNAYLTYDIDGNLLTDGTRTFSNSSTPSLPHSFTPSLPHSSTPTLPHSSTSQLFIPFYDNNGNITRYLDSSGNTVAQYTYDAFGNTVSQSGPLADFFRHRFSTKYFDIETGLYYYGYRFYHPVLMRWLNRDPMEEDGGVNLYCFVQNASTFAYDAFGHRRSNLPGIIMNALCEDAYNFAKKFLHTPQELRAWDRYTKHGWRGRDNDIELTPEEVKAIAESINAVVLYVQEKRSSCMKGIKFSVSTSIGDAAPSPWVKALGGVSIQVSTSCNDGCFSLSCNRVSKAGGNVTI